MLAPNRNQSQHFLPDVGAKNIEFNCPPLPHTILRAMELLKSTDLLTNENVWQMVKRDPFLATRVLSIVNLSHAGKTHAVSCIEEAVALMGPVSVAGLTVGMNSLDIEVSINEVAGRYILHAIRHVLAVANMARHLLRDEPSLKTGEKPANIAFTAGLLHDYGKILLMYNFPDKAPTFYGKMQKGEISKHLNPLDVERRIFGQDHVMVGANAARALGLSSLVTSVIRHHHEGNVAIIDPDLILIISAVKGANLACNALGFAFGGPIPWENCVADPVWDYLAERLSNKYHNRVDILEDVHNQQAHLFDDV